MTDEAWLQLSRTIVWFSCGAASACAAYLCPEAEVVYCDTLAEEHPDNRRFMRDVEEWTGRKVTLIRSTQFSSVSDVFEKTRYMAGIKGARCTVEMKKVPRFAFQRWDDTHVFGLTADEGSRIKRFEENNPDLTLRWVLREHGLTKDDCYAMLKDARIALPVMYSLGFRNNNCIGCVKSTSAAYWDRVRRHFPEVFARRARQSRDIGVRLTRYKGVRVFLDELPQLVEDKTPEQDIECGPVCLTEATA